MNKKLLLLLFSIILISGCKGNKPVSKISQSDIEHSTHNEKDSSIANQILNANWETEKVSDAIIYKYYHFTDLFSSIQSVTVIDVDLNKNVKVDIPYVNSGFIKTSEAAINSNSTAEINGSYFNT